MVGADVVGRIDTDVRRPVGGMSRSQKAYRCFGEHYHHQIVGLNLAVNFIINIEIV